MNGLIEDHRSDLCIDRMVGQAVEWISLKRDCQAVRKQQKNPRGGKKLLSSPGGLTAAGILSCDRQTGEYGDWQAETKGQSPIANHCRDESGRQCFCHIFGIA
jgi:hypothetical protein